MLVPHSRKILLALASAAFFVSPISQAEQPDLMQMSLEELLKVKVSTASMTEQTVKEAPARVEVITADDLKRRGYKDLGYLFDDLPGIAVTRTYGDNYFNVFWRGVRHTIGNSMLLLLDGDKLNHLYTNESEIIAALPIASIDHIEIVYGPASVLYGSDAVVGIVNIITRKDKENQLLLETGSNQRRTADIYWSHNFNELKVRLAARWNQVNTDFSRANEYQWTNPSLLSDARIWGEWATKYGQLESERKQQGFDLTLNYENDEFRYLFAEIASGYGLEYTFDHSLPNGGPWLEPTTAIHWKHKFDLYDNFKLQSIVRYRNTSFDSDSRFIEGYLSTDVNNNPVRLTDLSYWQSINRSRQLELKSEWQFSHDFNWVNGVDLEYRSLQKAYNINFGPSLEPADVDLNAYPFPAPPDRDGVARNRKNTSQKSAYSLIQYQLDKTDSRRHTLHFGVRWDQHSEFDNQLNFRTGYVGSWETVTAKLFYGEAFQEPPSRLLYGAWQGSGADPNLQPREANTVEFNLDWHQREWSLGLNLFDMRSQNLFNATQSGAVNSGLGNSRGGDLRFKFRSGNFKNITGLTIWASYSWISSEEQVADNNGKLNWEKVGDVANNMFHYGAYVDLNDNWQVNLRGRWYDSRETIKTNPLGEIDSLHAIDLGFNYQPDENYWQLNFLITNLTDALNFHPGVRSAGASTTPGFFDANNVWIGSGDFYNAQIVQPGREYRLQLNWRF